MSVPATPKRRRPRLLRYSLRSLLVATAVIGVLLAVWVVPAQRQKQIVAAIRSAGGNVRYDCQEANEPAPKPKWVGKLLGVDYVARPEVVWLLPDSDKALTKDCSFRLVNWKG